MFGLPKNECLDYQKRMFALPKYGFMGGFRTSAPWQVKFPGVGSALVEPSLRRAYGGTCLKLLVPGYEVLYERDDPQDAVDFLGVVPQRKVR